MDDGAREALQRELNELMMKGSPPLHDDIELEQCSVNLTDPQSVRGVLIHHVRPLVQATRMNSHMLRLHVKLQEEYQEALINQFKGARLLAGIVLSCCAAVGAGVLYVLKFVASLKGVF